MPNQPKPPTQSLDAIRGITDPTEQAREAVGFAAYAVYRARQGRAVRDDALRALQEAGISKPDIARRTGINLATVKAVLR